jgi:hypothetical protein
MAGGQTVARQQDRPVIETARDDIAQRMERLPPGHPSSPYNDDGSKKPPVARVTDRELPLPDEYADGEPAVPGSPPADDPEPKSLKTSELTNGRQPESTPPDGPEPANPQARAPDTRSWWQALPRLKEQWENHKERWPEQPPPPADHPPPEPNSWRGDSGQYLNTEENLVAEHALERIRTAEEHVSPVLQEIKAEVPGCDLVGLEFRLKGEDRFKEKISAELRAKPDRPIAAISESMPDALRYTFQFDSANYADGYWNILHHMELDGYQMEFSRNTWSGPQYKGINTRWRTPAGQVFEVQFHTQESFDAKQLTHEAYERIRNPAASDQERGELHKFQSRVSANIPLPEDALTIPDYRRKEG